jgi:chorismate mutase
VERRVWEIEKQLSTLRERIDAIDVEVVRLVNERAKFAAKIGRLEHTSGDETYAPAREREVLDKVVLENKAPPARLYRDKRRQCLAKDPGCLSILDLRHGVSWAKADSVFVCHISRSASACLYRETARAKARGSGKAITGGSTARAYVLLETVIASGLLVVGLAVIGAQIQDSDTAIHKMERRTRATMLTEQQLAFLDLGLIELESLDELEEGDFGPREPNWGWQMLTETTSVDGMFRLKLDVMHHLRDGKYSEDTFEYDDAEVILSTYVFRAAPQSLDLAADFGLTDEEFEVVSEKLAASGLAGFDAFAFDPSILAKLEPQELLAALPIVLDVLGIDLGDLESVIPPEVLRDLKEAGLFGGDEGGSGDQGGGS